MSSFIEDAVKQFNDENGEDKILALIVGDIANGKIDKLEYDENLKTTVVEMTEPVKDCKRDTSGIHIRIFEQLINKEDRSDKSIDNIFENVIDVNVMKELEDYKNTVITSSTELDKLSNVDFNKLLSRRPIVEGNTPNPVINYVVNTEKISLVDHLINNCGVCEIEAKDVTLAEYAKNNSLLPLIVTGEDNKDIRCITCTSISGGTDSTEGMPNKITLELFDINGVRITGSYMLATKDNRILDLYGCEIKP